MPRPSQPFFRSKTLCHAISLGLIPGMLGAGAHAADRSEEVEEIVVTASGISQRLVDAPASISVISAVEIQTRPYMTLIDAVRELEGVDVGETSRSEERRVGKEARSRWAP